MTHEEQFALDAQEHLKFTDMPEDERSRLLGQIEGAWAKVPENLRNKARKLAGK
jgi:hypothetical protein